MDAPDNEATGGLIVLAAGPEDAGTRLDQWLAARLQPDLSRSRIQALIRDGRVTLNGAAAEARRKVSPGDRVTVGIPEPEAAAPAGEAIPLAILHEDDQLIVVDKPAGMVTHPGAGQPTGTLVNALVHHCGDSLSGIGGVRRPGIVHRLDKDTSGVMVVAKTDLAHRALAEAFADHGRDGELERAYDALVWNAPERAAGTVDAALGRAADRVRRAVVGEDRQDARHAVTHWQVRERFAANAAALLDCRLETGRTHQIRVHMAHIGHPLVGDPDYGSGFRTKANRLDEPLRGLVQAFPRQALHARLLAFRHPSTVAMMRFETPPPDDMRRLIEGFRAA